MSKYQASKGILSDIISRRKLLKLAGGAVVAGLALPGLAVPARKKPAKPNIVFILGDNHRADAMGCSGHPFIKTPGMDRLAREGVRFENAFNTTSLCTPARASILTGAYAGRHGVKNNHTPWNYRMTTFLEYLAGSGYATAFIGKWHMPGKGLPDLPFLDLFVSYTYREGQGSYFDCPLIVNGKDMPSRKSYISEEVTDWAVEFMGGKHRRAGNARKPFCIYLSHRPAHPPFTSPEGIAGMYRDADVKSALPKVVDPWWFGKTRRNVFQGIMMGSYYDQYRRYCETITAMDREVVRLLDAIDREGLRDNTLVIYMGDNGMSWGEHAHHGIRESYEQVILVPFIVRAPWLIPDPGSLRRAMALNIDIAPTLLDIAGVGIPADMDGESLIPLISNGRAEGRKAWMLEFWHYYPEPTPTYVGVRTDRYKYVEFRKGRKPWLFDLEEDPREERNLYGTPEGEKLLPRMKALLEKLKKGR
ncbi:MAG: sulfatase-like hydrolase/transferase [Spirochaetes bacterium]|nr:sulfatase-like hydrolase/transferase [Spirochaetota bacterium]